MEKLEIELVFKCSINMRKVYVIMITERFGNNGKL